MMCRRAATILQCQPYLSERSGLLHPFAHINPAASLLFISIFASAGPSPLFAKDIWVIIFSHLLQRKLSKKNCGALAVELAKARLAYSFLRIPPALENQDERVALIDSGLGAQDVNALRNVIASAKNEGQHEMIKAWIHTTLAAEWNQKAAHCNKINFLQNSTLSILKKKLRPDKLLQDR